MSPADAVAFFEKVTQETGHPSIVVWGPPVFTFKALWLPEAYSVSAPSFLELARETKGLYERMQSSGRLPGRAGS